jgi:hypothetical protein
MKDGRTEAWKDKKTERRTEGRKEDSKMEAGRKDRWKIEEEVDGRKEWR